MWTVDAAKTLHLRGAILPPIAVLPVVKTPLALGRGLYESEFHLFKRQAAVAGAGNAIERALGVKNVRVVPPGRPFPSLLSFLRCPLGRFVEELL